MSAGPSGIEGGGVNKLKKEMFIDFLVVFLKKKFMTDSGSRAAVCVPECFACQMRQTP